MTLPDHIEQALQKLGVVPPEGDNGHANVKWPAPKRKLESNPVAKPGEF